MEKNIRTTYITLTSAKNVENKSLHSIGKTPVNELYYKK